jgi:hypothetical protein
LQICFFQRKFHVEIPPNFYISFFGFRYFLYLLLHFHLQPSGLKNVIICRRVSTSPCYVTKVGFRGAHFCAYPRQPKLFLAFFFCGPRSPSEVLARIDHPLPYKSNRLSIRANTSDGGGRRRKMVKNVEEKVQKCETRKSSFFTMPGR